MTTRGGRSEWSHLNKVALVRWAYEKIDLCWVPEYVGNHGMPICYDNGNIGTMITAIVDDDSKE